MSDEFKDAPDRDGWMISTDGRKRYLSPGGKEISYYQYRKLNDRYKDQDIPEHAIDAASGISATLTALKSSPPKTFMQPKSAPGVATAPSVSPLEELLQQQHVRTTSQAGVDIGRQAPPSQRPPVLPQPELQMDDADQVREFKAPTPKPDAARGRPSANRATPREISDGLYISITIATSIVAILLREPVVAMTDLEAKGISIPAANLLAKSKLNERFGRMIAESGDWQLLGYAIWMYSSRVWDIQQAKVSNRQRPQQPYQQGYQPHPISQPASPNGHQWSPSIVLPKPPPGVGGGLS